MKKNNLIYKTDSHYEEGWNDCLDKILTGKTRQTKLSLEFTANFYTGHDFNLGDLSKLIDTENSLYNGAIVDYNYTNYSDSGDFNIWLKARGEINPCKWACRDLLEHMMCSISTRKHYLIKELYDSFEWFHHDLFKNTNNTRQRTKGLSGNYDGTWMTLKLEEN